MRIFKFTFSFLFILLLALPAYGAEKILIVATTPDLKSVAQEVGGDKVKVVSLSKGYQDTHYVTPSLKLMSIANKADLFVEIGLDYELWSEKVLDGARNSRIKRGAPGYVRASQGISVLEKPRVISRSEGDLHPYGNPHFYLDPINMKIAADNITAGLTRIAGDNTKYWKEQNKSFDQKLSQAMYGKKLVELFGGELLDRLSRKGRLIPFLKGKKLSDSLKKKLGVDSLVELLGGWVKASLAFRGKKIVFFHKQWAYFASRFGLEIAAYIEEKPGISPSSSHRAYLLKKIKEEDIQVIAVANFYNASVPKALAKETGAEVIIVPTKTGGIPEVKSYFDLIDHLVKKLGQAYGK